MDVKWFELKHEEYKIIIWNTMTMQVFKDDVLVATLNSEAAGHILVYGAMLYGDMVQEIKSQATKSFSIEDLLQ